MQEWVRAAGLGAGGLKRGPQGEMKMHMTGAFAAETFTVNQAMDMKGPTGAMHSKAKVSGKRTGDCAAGVK